MQHELLQCKVVEKYYYDCHTKPLNKLAEDEPVQMQVEDTCHSAQVTKLKVCQNTPQSYIITTPQGKSYQRNRRHLRTVNEK